VALYEAMFNTLEAVVPEYDGAGVIRQPSGTTVTGIVPTNTYRCADGKFVIIGGNGDSIFKRLMKIAGAPEMAEDPELADNAGRVTHEKKIDGVLSAWCAAHASGILLEKLKQANVPGGPVCNVEDMMNDPHYQDRGMFETVDTPQGKLKIPAITPKLQSTPGRTDWAGPSLGQHNKEIYGQWLGLTDDELKQLTVLGVI
jgi:crotonobetainyl-CoA:carnitine CoA-transferase CaiB-like acyl-CoA transferase